MRRAPPRCAAAGPRPRSRRAPGCRRRAPGPRRPAWSARPRVASVSSCSASGLGLGDDDVGVLRRGTAQLAGLGEQLLGVALGAEPSAHRLRAVGGARPLVARSGLRSGCLTGPWACLTSPCDVRIGRPARVGPEKRTNAYPNGQPCPLVRASNAVVGRRAPPDLGSPWAGIVQRRASRAGLEEHRGAWDALGAPAGDPFALPTLVVARGSGAEDTTYVLVLDGDQLVGGLALQGAGRRPGVRR